MYAEFMKTLTIRDFRSRPKEARLGLAGEKEALLTANGKPVAILLPVDAASLDETMSVLRRARSLQTLSAIRLRAKAKGLDRISMDEIGAEIQAVRSAKRKLARKTGRA